MNSARLTTTMSNSEPTPLAPMPSPTQDAGARKTASTSTAPPTPSQKQLVPQRTGPNESNKQQHTGAPQTQAAGMEADGTRLKTDISSPNQQGSVQGKTSSVGHVEPTSTIMPNIIPLGSPDPKIDEEGQTIRLPPAVVGGPISIGGLAVKLNSNGAYINNAVVTPGAAP